MNNKENNKVKKIPMTLSNWQNQMDNSLCPAKLSIGLVKYPVITEKSYLSFFKNKQYTFDVDSRLTKTQIKKLFETLFDVNVVAVNTQILPRKKIRAGITQGYKPRYKRAILTLKEGQWINYSSSK